VTVAHEYYFVHFLELISLKPGDKLIVLAFTGKSGFCKLACRAKQIETNKCEAGCRCTRLCAQQNSLLLFPSPFGCHQLAPEGLHRDGLQCGAGDGARTRDSLLGKQELYYISFHEHCSTSGK
jgi:hypothetical protein